MWFSGSLPPAPMPDCALQCLLGSGDLTACSFHSLPWGVCRSSSLEPWAQQLPLPLCRGDSLDPFLTDIQFWNSRQSLEGLSVRSVFFGVFQSLVVLLYILDNETNFVVQVSVFIGLLIDLWKITKVMDVRVSSNTGTGGVLAVPLVLLGDVFPLSFGSWTERTR